MGLYTTASRAPVGLDHGGLPRVMWADLRYPEQFVEFYYNTFDTDRKALNALYVSQNGQPSL